MSLCIRLQSLVLLPALLAFAQGGIQVQQKPRLVRPDGPRGTNLGLAVLGGAQVSGSTLAVAVWETGQGADLNGDGDLGDLVLHVTGTAGTRNTGLATSGALAVQGGLVATTVREEAVDLNGDGDTLDLILHLWDEATGTATNAGLAASNLRVSEDLLVFTVTESEQEVDLNGDGDQSDAIVHVLDLTGGGLTNLRLGTSPGNVILEVVERRVLFVVPEFNSDDLNGDGDTDDYVVHLYDASSGLTHNLALPVANVVDLGTDHVAMGVPEADQGVDLNGDADLFDVVFHVADATTLAVTNTGLAVQSSSSTQSLGSYQVFLAQESSQGVDLNGDGDLMDLVLTVHDAALGVTTVLGLATQAGAEAFAADGDVVAFSVIESSQGTDLNGDGNLGDFVAHVHQLSSGVTTNLELSTNWIFFATPMLVSDGLVSFSAFEDGVDLNEDGAADGDFVAHFYEVATGVLTNSKLAANVGVAAAGTPVSSRGALLKATEAAQGADLNGDGDLTDTLLFGWERATQRSTNLRVSGFVDAFDGRFAAIAVDENLQDGGTVLNDDGDTLDDVLRRIRF